MVCCRSLHCGGVVFVMMGVGHILMCVIWSFGRSLCRSVVTYNSPPSAPSLMVVEWRLCRSFEVLFLVFRWCIVALRISLLLSHFGDGVAPDGPGRLCSVSFGSVSFICTWHRQSRRGRVVISKVCIGVSIWARL